MKNAAVGFRDLVGPLSAEKFFAEIYRQRPLHVPGADDKFASVFSWDDLNGLLRMTTIWSDHTCEISKDGTSLYPEAYCFQGTNRENQKAWKPDFAMVRRHLREGATMTLNFLERLTPGLQDLSLSLASVLAAPVNCSAFLSWQGKQGYPAHFDTTNVFVLQIAGSKRWNLYERRLPRAAHTPGSRYMDFPQEHHDRVKGAVMQEVMMTPGDLLYLPHGQYHDALASGDHSLHLSFAVRHLVARDFIDVLSRDLPKDPFFREHLPPHDAAGAHEQFRRLLGDRLRQVVGDPQVGEDLRRYLAQRAFELVGDFRLPERSDPKLYRVRWLGRGLERHGNGWRLNGRGAAADLDETHGTIAEWALRRDFFTDRDLAEAFAFLDAASQEQAVGRLEALEVIEAV